MSETLTADPRTIGQIIQMPRRIGAAIRTETEALWAIIENADYTGTDENGFALMTFRASPRLLDFLETYGTGSAA